VDDKKPDCKVRNCGKQNHGEEIAWPRREKCCHQDGGQSKQADCAIEVPVSPAETALKEEERAGNEAERDWHYEQPSDPVHEG
jgi:hypothetical protein